MGEYPSPKLGVQCERDDSRSTRGRTGRRYTERQRLDSGKRQRGVSQSFRQLVGVPPVVTSFRLRFVLINFSIRLEIRNYFGIVSLASHSNSKETRAGAERSSATLKQD